MRILNQQLNDGVGRAHTQRDDADRHRREWELNRQNFEFTPRAKRIGKRPKSWEAELVAKRLIRASAGKLKKSLVDTPVRSHETLWRRSTQASFPAWQHATFIGEKIEPFQRPSAMSGDSPESDIGTAGVLWPQVTDTAGSAPSAGRRWRGASASSSAARSEDGPSPT